MLDDTDVNEDTALEMEQLLYEYRPHEVETIGLQSDDDEGEDDDEPEDDSNLQLSDVDMSTYFTPEMDGHSGLGEAVY